MLWPRPWWQTARGGPHRPRRRARWLHRRRRVLAEGACCVGGTRPGPTRGGQPHHPRYLHRRYGQRRDLHGPVAGLDQGTRWTTVATGTQQLTEEDIRGGLDPRLRRAAGGSGTRTGSGPPTTVGCTGAQLRFAEQGPDPVTALQRGPRRLRSPVLPPRSAWNRRYRTHAAQARVVVRHRP